MTTPRIDELIDFLDRERAYLADAVDSVPAERHNQRPAADAWCVSQVIQHLAQTEGSVAGLLTRITDEARANGVPPDAATTSILEAIPTNHIVDRSRRIRNPRANPAPDTPVRDALAALDTSRDVLKALLRRPDLPDLRQVSAPHPAFGPLNGYEWVAFVAAHVHRHADQIREIGHQLAG